MNRYKKIQERLREIDVWLSDDDLENILETVPAFFDPEDIFSDTDLEEWAYDHGFKPE